VLRRGGSPQRLLTTVLFTDIVGSTERAARLGDRGWKDLVARHHAIVRRELRRFHGRELDTAGDGFFATFERPAQAIECAAAIIDDLRALDLQIRAGIHMGEAEVMGGKVGGVTVHVGSRVMSQAKAGEILVTSTVREVTAGADVRFDDRGVHEFKGVPGEWRLYAVEWQRREAAPAASAGEAAAAGRLAQTRLVTAIVLGAILVAAVVTGVAVMFLAGRGAPPTLAPLVAQRNSAVSFDSTTNAVRAVVPAGTSPTGIALADDTVWVVSQTDKLLTAVPASGGTARTIGLPGSPTGLAAGGGSTWITFGFGATGEAGALVLRVSAGTQRQEQRLPVPNGAGAIAVGEGGVWFANGLENTVTRIDPDTHAIGGVIQVGEQPGALAVGEGALWVAHSVGKTVWRIEPATSSKKFEVPLRDAPTAIAVGFGRLWVTSNVGNTVVVIDAARGGLVSTIGLDQGPRGIAVSSDAVWVAGIRNTLLRIDPATLKLATSIVLPGPAEGVAVAKDGVWVTVQE
jgi:class 3 adenylate cyclase